MRTINELMIEYVNKGLTTNQAESGVCQQIIINKISKSKFADNVLLKGGVVMFYLTNNTRRATIDLDFDFIRYDISDASIRSFIKLLNRYDEQYKISVIETKELKQDDYHGKRVLVNVNDQTRNIKFKLDIGVHTLLAIEQTSLCFSFEEGETFLKANPPEQMVSEKLYSLAKHNALSGRYKDVYDIYYLIANGNLNKKIVKKCLELLTINGLYGINSIEDVCDKVSEALEDGDFLSHLDKTKDKWIDEDTSIVTKTIIDYIYSI